MTSAEEFFNPLLEEICKKYGREDLYRILIITIPEDPRKIKITGAYVSHFDYAIYYLFHGNDEEAKKNFLECSKQAGLSRLKIVADNYEDVKKIAKEYWERLGIISK